MFLSNYDFFDISYEMIQCIIGVFHLDHFRHHLRKFLFHYPILNILKLYLHAFIVVVHPR